MPVYDNVTTSRTLLWICYERCIGVLEAHPDLLQHFLGLADDSNNLLNALLMHHTPDMYPLPGVAASLFDAISSHGSKDDRELKLILEVDIVSKLIAFIEISYLRGIIRYRAVEALTWLVQHCSALSFPADMLRSLNNRSTLR